MSDPTTDDGKPRFRRRSKTWEGGAVKWLFLACALVSILTTVGILVSLVINAWGFFTEIPIWDYLFGTRWSPILKPRDYGVLPLVSGTLLVTLIGALVAVPIGLASAIFLSEYAPDRLRRIIKPVLEILGGEDYETASSDAKLRIHATWSKLEALGYTVTPIRNHDYLALPNPAS